MVRRFEMVIRFKSDLSDDRLREEAGKVRGVIERGGGQVTTYDDWGKKKLAHPIKKETRGSYHLFQFSAEPPVLMEVDRVLKLNEAVLRHMTVKMREERVAPKEAAREA